jgi:hypothetical protein
MVSTRGRKRGEELEHQKDRRKKEKGERNESIRKKDRRKEEKGERNESIRKTEGKNGKKKNKGKR